MNRNTTRISFEDHEENDIINLYQAGKSCDSIGEKYNTTKNTIKRFLENNGYYKSGFIKKATKEQIDDICNLYVNDEMKISHIAMKYNVESPAIKNILIQNNVYTKERMQIAKYVKTSDFKIIYEKYLNGTPQKILANEYGVSRNNIRKILIAQIVYHSDENKIYELSLDIIYQMFYFYIINKTPEEISNILNVNINAVLFLFATIKNTTEYYTSGTRWTYRVNENYFNQIDTPNKAYVLGMMFSDGCHYRQTSSGLNRYVMTLGLQEGDIHILQDILNDMESSHPIYYRQSHDYGKYHCQPSYYFAISNKQISDDLLKWNIVQNKTFVIEFPNYLDDDLISHFIRGYFDGDGSVSKKGWNVSFTCASKQYLLSLQDLLLKKNITTKLYKVKDKQLWDLRSMRKSESKKLLDWIYKDLGDNLKLNRKYDIYINRYNF